MATVKSHTDLQQSKKLAEILSAESADMEYMFLKTDNSMVSKVPFVKDGFEEPDCSYNLIPCWSLVALLAVLPKIIGGYYINIGAENTTDWCIYYEHLNGKTMLFQASGSLVDACYEMILRLHEQNLL